MASQEDIQNYYFELSAWIEDIPGAFIYNVDETGCCEWVDATEVKVIVPKSYFEERINIPVDRNSKRATLIGCIVGDGTNMKPMIILPRKTIENDIFLAGYNENNVLFAHQKNGFMTTTLFEYWAENVFFEEIESKRTIYDYQGPALLILDGFKCHHSEKFILECNDRNIYTLFLVPHSSDQYQPLDLVTFGVMKKNYPKMSFRRFETKQSNQIVKILGSWYQSTAPHLVIGAFIASGMKQYEKNGMLYWKIDLENATRVTNYQIGNDIPLLIEENSRVRIDI